MGHFDFLIAKNKEPKVGLEYVYLLDETWKPNELGSYPIKYGSIVTNVKKLDNDSLEFTDKESGETYRTNYGWSLAENTPKNLERIERYLKSKEELDKLEKRTQMLRDEIKDLNGPKRI